MTLQIDDQLRLELTAEQHAESLFNAVDANRSHLAAFLPWVHNMNSVNDFTNYVKNCDRQYSDGSDISFVIHFKEEVVGRIGLHGINQQNKSAAIGYWLVKKAEGNGIITKCCQTIISFGFDKLNLHRIEIKAATMNTRSQAIPQRLHFTFECVLREAEFVNNQFLDITLYSMLKHEWNIK